MSRILFNSFDSEISTLSLSAVETIDVAVFAADAIIKLLLSASDAKDTAEIQGANIVSAVISDIENTDTVSVTADIDSFFELSATETLDSARILVGEQASKTHPAQVDWSLLLKLIPNKAKFNIIENQDSARIEIEHIHNIFVRVMESGDRCKVSALSQQQMKFTAFETGDGIKNDEMAFREYVEDLYARYEEEIMFAIIRAA